VIYSKVENRYEVSGLAVPGESPTKAMIWLSLSSDLLTVGVMVLRLEENSGRNSEGKVPCEEWSSERGFDEG
jgi:hypothetical protein